MKKSKKIIILIISSILSLGIFQVISKYFTTFAQDSRTNNDTLLSEEIRHTCYKPAPIKTIEPTITGLKNKLDTLEKQYKEQKIDEKTYNLSKDNILKEIKKLEDK